MSKNKEYPYSFVQIAGWIGIEKRSMPPIGVITWVMGRLMIGRELPNFYDPQHNWWVREAVYKLARKFGYTKLYSQIVVGVPEKDSFLVRIFTDKDEAIAGYANEELA